MGKGDEYLSLPRSLPGLESDIQNCAGPWGCEGEAFAFLSEGHLAFPWQGNYPPWNMAFGNCLRQEESTKL